MYSCQSLEIMRLVFGLLIPNKRLTSPVEEYSCPSIHNLEQRPRPNQSYQSAEIRYPIVNCDKTKKEAESGSLQMSWPPQSLAVSSQ